MGALMRPLDSRNDYLWMKQRIWRMEEAWVGAARSLAAKQNL